MNRVTSPIKENGISSSETFLPGAYPPKTSNESTENAEDSIPPLSLYQKIPGYETATFNTTTIPPPTPFAESQQSSPHRQHSVSFPNLTENQAREAALDFVSQKCCYGKDVVRNMDINDINQTNTFHYLLETFAEQRAVVWCCEPYKGEPLDTPILGPAPLPWEITLIPIEEFEDATQQIEVPHTASAFSCHVCTGKGKENCEECKGNGQVICKTCSDSDQRSTSNTCSTCNGSGNHRCEKCNGSGQEKCKTCMGKGRLKSYLKLIATWKKHKDECISEQTIVPKKLIRDVIGHVIFEENGSRVWPISHFPQANINEASCKLIAEHSKAFPSERILQQRQKVQIIPAAEVKYSWKDKSGQFFVYGYENQVYFPNYPQPFSCGCIIL